jgi:hypothetical protein
LEGAFRVAGPAILGVEVEDHLCGWMEEVLVVVVAFEVRDCLRDVHDFGACAGRNGDLVGNQAFRPEGLEVSVLELATCAS